jgi:TP901 family phage tail tape measure protein
LYGDMSELQKALGRTEGLSGKYSATLSNLTKGMDKNSLSIKDAEKAMYSTDKVLRTLNRSFSTQLEQAASGTRSWDNLVSKYGEFSKAANLGTISQKVLRGELKATDGSIKGYIQSVTNGKVTFDKFTESKKKSWPIINQVNKAIDAGSQSWQSAARQQSAYQAAIKKTGDNTETLSQKFRKIVGNSNGVNTAFRMMNKAVLDGNMTWQEMLQVQNRWKANEIASKVQKETKSFKDQTKEVGLLSRAFTSLFQSLRTIASYGAASAIIYGVTRAFAAGKTEIVEYDQALKNLQAISGATAAEIEIMDGVMQEVARRTKFSTVEIGQAMVLLGQSGFSAAESVSSINAVAMLATGTLSDMTNTADLLTTTIRAYNLEAIEANRVSDVMANAINKSKLTLDKLRIAFNYVGATASQAGLTLEETAASLMMLANNGLRASTMGTGLRQILAKMVAPTAKVKAVLEGVSMSIDSINPGVVGFQQALTNLRTAMVDTKGIVDMSKAFEMFGLRGAQAAAVLIRSLGPTGGFHDAIDTVYEVGTAAHMASIQQEGLAIKIKNMADRAKSLAIAFGNAGIAGAMKLFVDTIRYALGAILSFTDTMGGKLVLNLTVVTALVYGLITALRLLGVQSLLTGMMTLAAQGGLLAAVLTKLGVVIGVLLNPVVLVSAAIAGVGIAINWLINRIDNAIIKHQKLQAEHEATSDSLELYAKAIEETDGAGREYQSLLQRLKEEHPELKKVIDENAFSHIALAEAMKEVAKQKQEAAYIEQAKALDSFREKLEQTKKAFENVAFFAQGDDSEKSWKAFYEGSEKGRLALADFESEAKKFAASLFDTFGSDGFDQAKEQLVSMLTLSGISPDRAKEIIDAVLEHYREFQRRRKEIAETAIVEQKDMAVKAAEILDISKHIMAEQYESEKEVLNKKLEAIKSAYDQEVKLAEFAAIQKKSVIQKGSEDEIRYRQDSMGQYVDMERNAQQQLVSFKQKGSDQVIQIIRDENGKIIAASEDQMATLIEKEKAYQEQQKAIAQVQYSRLVSADV